MLRRKLLLGAGAGAFGSALVACGGGSQADPASVDSSLTEKDAASAGPTATALPPPSNPKARVVVVGGGFAGATVAKFVRLWGDQVDVTLVERSNSYVSCPLSSLVLTGQRTIPSLTFTYERLRTRYGVRTVFGDVVAIDPARPSVTMADGSTLNADRVVLAPGIDFDGVPGLADPMRMPHAWKAGAQTTALAQQLAAMPAGGTVVLTIPLTPYRCPPGPYERACLLADWLKQRKPGSKLVVLDANPDFVVEKDNFSQAFFGLHASVIEYHANAVIDSVDTTAMALDTNLGRVRANVVNLIPRQRAGGVIASAGLNNATGGRFAGVNALSYASTVAGAARVHVIGDACGTTQPKSGHIANQEAKVCADALTRAFAGQSPDPAPVTSSACFSTITMKHASWLHSMFRYDAATAQMVGVAAASQASAGWNGDHFEDMGIWFRALASDTFA